MTADTLPIADLCDVEIRVLNAYTGLGESVVPVGAAANQARERLSRLKLIEKRKVSEVFPPSYETVATHRGRLVSRYYRSLAQSVAENRCAALGGRDD